MAKVFPVAGEGFMPPVKGDPDFAIFQAGVQHGTLQMKSKVLGFLQDQYLSKEVERGSVRGNMLLKIARELSEYINRTTRKP